MKYFSIDGGDDPKDPSDTDPDKGGTGHGDPPPK